ncbi:unnamed protein product, partial [Mesorhabditis spiculigera]
MGRFVYLKQQMLGLRKSPSGFKKEIHAEAASQLPAPAPNPRTKPHTRRKARQLVADPRAIRAAAARHKRINKDMSALLVGIQAALGPDHDERRRFSYGQGQFIKILDPQWFRNAREKNEIDEEGFKQSLTGQPWHNHLIRGNSSSVIYFSNDEKYIIKTAEKIEIGLLRAIFSEFKEHMQKADYHSFLPNYLAVFTSVSFQEPENGHP